MRSEKTFAARQQRVTAVHMAVMLINSQTYETNELIIYYIVHGCKTFHYIVGCHSVVTVTNIYFNIYVTAPFAVV